MTFKCVSNPKNRTMWMFPRNIRRILPWKLSQISTLLLACDGNIQSQDIQDSLYEALSGLGVKCRRNSEGVDNAGGFRTYLAQLACLGLFWKSADGYKTTVAGDEIISGSSPGRVLRCQLLRMQYPSAYGYGTMVSMSPNIKIKPFSFLIRLLQDERLGCRLSVRDMAIPVVFAHQDSDYESCVARILMLREHDNDLSAVIQDVTLVETSRRRVTESADEEDVLRKGIQDAFEIANTAKNYMQAAFLLIENEEDSTFSLTPDQYILNEIKPWLLETKIYPVSADNLEAAQQFYGRYDKTKGVRPTVKQERADGFAALIRNSFFTSIEADPYGVDIPSFVKAQSKKWEASESQIHSLIEPLIPKRASIERDVLTEASLSGGKKAQLLEKGVTNLLRRLGFSESRHIGQLKPKKKRDGGFPDIYIKEKAVPTCGLGDTKATVKYKFDLGDKLKLGAYYRDCASEIDPNVPCDYFLYIAGGFERDSSKVEQSLADCQARFGRPVSAVTVEALLSLSDKKAEGKIKLSDDEFAQELNSLFKSGKYYSSAEQIVGQLSC